jgi:cytoskeletal protein RodZ
MADWNLSTEEVGVGTFLRRNREERGISIEEVASSTRVRTFYLEKIENEEFNRLPAVPIGRGFIRAYARYIGVDDDEVVHRYNQNVGAISEDIDNDLGEKIIFSPYASRKPFALLLPVTAVVLFILASGAFLWFVRGKTESFGRLGGFTDRIKAVAGPAIGGLKNFNSASSGRNGSNGDRPLVRSTPEKISMNAPENISIAGGGPVQGDTGAVNDKSLKSLPENALPQPDDSASLSPPQEAVSEIDQAKAEGDLGLTIQALEDTWLRLKVDARETIEILLIEGTEKSWRGSDRFTLTVGNAAGTKVLLNDRVVSLPQTTSNVVREFVITDKIVELQQASSVSASD